MTAPAGSARLLPRSVAVVVVALVAATLAIVGGRPAANAAPGDTINIADASAVEDTGSITFTITLAGTATGPVAGTWKTSSNVPSTPGSVIYDATSGHGCPSGDYDDVTEGPDDTGNAMTQESAGETGTFVIPLNQNSTTITVSICGDAFPEPNETFAVTINTSAAGCGDCTAVGTIVNNDGPAPVVSVADEVFTENVPGQFTFTLDKELEQAATLSYTIVYGSATSGDVTVAASPLTFASGDTSKTVAVTFTADTTPESTETFTLQIDRATNLSTPDREAQGTIVDDDTPPTISVAGDESVEGTTGTGTCTDTQTNFTTTEPQQCVVFPVTLSRTAGSGATVDYTTVSGTATAGQDFVPRSGQLTFSATETTRYITVRLNGDTTLEGNETFSLVLSNPTGATCATCTATGLINEGAPGIVVDDANVTEAATDTTVTVTFRLTTGNADPVTIRYSTTDGTAVGGIDYEPAAGQELTFPANDTEETIELDIYADSLDEATEAFTITATPKDAESTCLTSTDCQATVTIADEPADGPPSASIADAATSEGNSGTKNLAFPVTLSAPSGKTITMNYAAADGTATAAACDSGGDYNLAPGTLTIPAGQTSGTITAVVCGDEFAEATETFSVNLSSPQNVTLSDPSATGTITNDDGPAPTVASDDETVTEGNSGTTNARFTVSLSQSSGKTITVSYATSPTGASPASGAASCGNETDYVSQVGTLTFAPGETAKNVAVPVCGDIRDEPNETFELRLLGAENAVLASDANGLGTINDDDTTPSLVVNDASAPEATKALTFSIRLSAPSGLPVTVNYATANGTATAPGDYTATSGTATFAPGETTKDIVVTVNDDAVKEANETLTFTLSGVNANATIQDAQATGTIVNDDFRNGYWLVADDGGVFAFGDSKFHGSMGGVPLNKPIVGTASHPGGAGYWQVASDGGIFSFGDARFYGSTGSIALNSPVVGMAAFPGGTGYWLVAADGGVFAFGDAKFHGSMGGKPLNQPVVGMAPASDGKGYFLVARDGGIFAFGSAKFAGSTGSITLNQPIVGMAAEPNGKGYWFVAADGGIFAFGGAAFAGSAARTPLSAPITGMAPTSTGNGYWLVGRNGAVYNFGDAPHRGSAAGVAGKPIVGIAELSD